ncbi:histidine kinase 5, partial [Tanacetum coccineum]
TRKFLKCNSDIENINCNKKENPDDLPVASCSPSDNHSSNLCEARIDSNRTSEHSSSNQQEIGKSEKKPKILLVEDHVINVMVAKRMMRQLNQEMDIVNNGAEAVRADQKCKYDLILMVYDYFLHLKLIRSFEKNGNWDEATKAGVEPCDSPYDQNLEEPRRIPIIASI